MKSIIIYSTKDEVISLQLVNKIVSHDYLKNYKIDIILTNPNFMRKFKILVVMIFFGSIKDLFLRIRNKVSIHQIIRENKNCRLIENLEDKNYEFGLSVYCSSKIKIEKFKIYNFHLGSLYNQRGSFIFFYKFIKNWDKISLTFHEISSRFDVGRIINERVIKLKNNCFATDIFFAYLENLDFLIDSIKKINNHEYKEYKEFTKLNLVPSFYKLITGIFIFYLRKLKINKV